MKDLDVSPGTVLMASTRIMATRALASKSTDSGYNARQIVVLILCIVFGLLSMAVVGLRFWARRLKKVLWCLSDWLTVPALVDFYLKAWSNSIY